MLMEGMPGCGKTHLARTFGEENFGDVAYFDLSERRTRRALRRAGESAEALVEELSLLRGRGFSAGRTLLVLDGLSQGEGGRLLARLAAVGEVPVLGIASHPSLGQVGDTSPPCLRGGVSVMRLYPLSFGEFKDAFSSRIRQEREETLFRRYLRVGGLPGAVSAYLEEESLAAACAVHAAFSSRIPGFLAEGAPPKMFEKLSAVWQTVPLELEMGRERFRFADVRREWRAKDLEDAVAWLVRSGLLYRVPRVAAPGVWDGRSFSLYPADVGLLSFLLGGGEEGLLTRAAILGEWKSAGVERVSSWYSGNMARVDFLVGEAAVPVLLREGRIRARALSEYRGRFHPSREWTVSAEEEGGALPPWRVREILEDLG